jgi:hypothetical protein
VLEEHHLFRKPLRPCRSDIVFVNFFKKDGAGESEVTPDASYHTNQDGKRHKLEGIPSGIIAGDGEQFEHYAEEILASNNIEKSRDGHHTNAHDGTDIIKVGASAVCKYHGKGNFHQYAKEKGRERDEEARFHALFDLRGDVDVIAVTFSKIEPEQAKGFFKKDGLRDFSTTLFLVVDKKRKVVVVFSLPVIDCLLGNILFTQYFSCYLIR